MIEHEHLLAGRIGGYQREIAASFLVEFGERGGGQFVQARVEFLSNPGQKGVASIEAATLDKSKQLSIDRHFHRLSKQGPIDLVFEPGRDEPQIHTIENFPR